MSVVYDIDDVAPVAVTPPTPKRLPLRFTGSGSEYFRIWIVNLLLILVTLGIYFPWAKVRRLRYFYGNTLVGTSPLAFHGDPWLMLRGYALMAVVFVAYGIASRVSPVAALLALMALAAAWPALWRASMQFRMANTSWRGMRFGFTGSLGDAYGALLPIWLPALLLVGAGVVWEGDGDTPQVPGLWFGLIVLLSALFVPVALYRVKRYQHDHYAFGDQDSALALGWGMFYRLSLKASGLAFLCLMLPGVVAGVHAYRAAAAGTSAPSAAIVVPLAGLLGYLLIFMLVSPFFTARLQNLVWNATSSRRIRIESRLPARSLIGTTLKVWLLVPLTLGLYWPFARVALARLRLEAVSVQIDGGPEALAGGGAPRRPGAAGDAAGEFFGSDLGL